jgi:CheY-like chemotaxis protein
MKDILIVDDEEMVRYSVKRILETAGYRVSTAASGSECLERLRMGYHGLILMDIVMPGMDGWDTVQRVVDEGLYNGNLVCMLTGQDEPDVKMEHLKEYVLDYVRKPFEAKRLVQICEEYLSYLKEPSL